MDLKPTEKEQRAAERFHARPHEEKCKALLPFTQAGLGPKPGAMPKCGLMAAEFLAPLYIRQVREWHEFRVNAEDDGAYCVALCRLLAWAEQSLKKA